MIQDNTHSSRYFDQDSPLAIYKLCFPNQSDLTIERAVNKYKRKTYCRYINGDTFNMTTEYMLGLAIKNSLYSSHELDIMTIYNIEEDFREEVAQMYTISMELINQSTIAEIHKLKNSFELVEVAYGKRVKSQPERLSDKTLYNSKLTVNK